MDIRLALYRIADSHRIDAEATARLIASAGMADEPAGLSRHLPRGMAVTAAALGGLAVVLWIAANWSQMPRIGQFALLQALVTFAAFGAWVAPAGRPAIGLLALIGIGGLLAYFGQTYQTGADAWTLFAWWAVLALPLCLGLRSDVVWAPWALVAMVAISLWAMAHTGHRWRPSDGASAVYVVAWIAAIGIVAALSAPLQRWSGAGIWSLRTAATLALIMIGAGALGGLFHTDVQFSYWLGLALLAAAATLVAQPKSFDIFVASGLALALCTLLVAGLARLVLDKIDDAPGPLLLIGLAAAALLAAAVRLIIALQRSHDARSAS